MNQYNKPPTCFFSARFTRLSESILGTAYLLKDNRVGTASFVRLLFCLLGPHGSLHVNNETLLSEVFTTQDCYPTLSVYGGSTSRSFLNQVSLSLWSFGNLKKLNPFLSASLLEQSYVIQYTIVSRIHPKNMSHVWEMKPL